MGMLNAAGQVNMRTCIACQRHGIKPPLVDQQTMTFDYVCPTCNPRVTISVTDVVFGTNLLEQLRNNLEARSKFREEISEYTGEVFKVDTNIIQYFLGQTTHKPVTYYEWMEGNLTGDVRHWTETSSEDLAKIKQEQKKIFDKRVDKKLEYYKSKFATGMENSFDAEQLLVDEIDNVKNIIIKDRFKLPFKPIANEAVVIGDHVFRTYSTFTCIQEMYKAAISGAMDYGIVPSEKQKIAIAGMNAKVDCMVQAIAYGKYLKHLEALKNHKVEAPVDGKISSAGVEKLQKKFDEMKDEFREIVTKGLEDLDDSQHKLFYELQSGQKIIFDEFDELRDYLKSLNKKTWIQVLKSKLMLMLERQILSKATVDFIIEKLNIDELDLGTKLLN